MMERTVAKQRSKPTQSPKISARDVQVYYGDNHAIKDVNRRYQDNTVTAFIGPSGCGKSTFLRCLNRMNDTIDLPGRRDDPARRARISTPAMSTRCSCAPVSAWCFRSPTRFPSRSMTTSPTGREFTAGRNKAELDEIVEKALAPRAIWDEVKDRLAAPGTGLSGGQQQRLCIARAIATSRKSC